MDTCKTFVKKSVSIGKQLDTLVNRGLLVSDPGFAEHCLATVSYYRLSAYFKPFQHLGDPLHHFQPNTTFNRIWSLYAFDRQLRLLVSDALERIEIALRTALSNHMSKKYGNLWYLSERPFRDTWVIPQKRARKSQFEMLRQEIDEVCFRKKEDFIKHYYAYYDEPSYPPSWMMLECLSFGKCTSLFRNLRAMEDKKLVSAVFQYHPRVIESCLEPLRYTRNICAHHGRLWNRWFVYSPKQLRAFGTVSTRPRSFHE